ncbi:MAG: hypothetical protein WDZ41_03570 [Candidatus Babeliales bacterium]
MNESIQLIFDSGFQYHLLSMMGLGRYGGPINPWADIETKSYL